MKNIKRDSGPNLETLSAMSEEEARKMIEGIRWPDGPICPRCNSVETVPVTGKQVRAGVYRCKTCRRNKAKRDQFSVTIGTVFEGSHIPLKKWVMAFHLMCSSKKGISALQLKRNLGLSYKSAWHMAHRVRLAMKEEPLSSMLAGTVEADETFVGGKPRRSRKGTLPSPRGRKGWHIPKKSPVAVLVERGGDAISFPIKRISAKGLKTAIREKVDRTKTVFMTDDAGHYKGIGREFAGGHQTVMHSGGEYVRDDAHIQTAESFFALLKRGVNGVFHHVSEKHLGRYCDEFSFRWNHRKVNDGTRTICAISGAEGKRLMYSEPIRKSS
jgi:transposase-like protein